MINIKCDVTNRFIENIRRNQIHNLAQAFPLSPSKCAINFVL